MVDFYSSIFTGTKAGAGGGGHESNRPRCACKVPGLISHSMSVDKPSRGAVELGNNDKWAPPISRFFVLFFIFIEQPRNGLNNKANIDFSTVWRASGKRGEKVHWVTSAFLQVSTPFNSFISQRL